MHGERASQRRLLVELACAAAVPPLCISPPSCLVRYVLGLPGLLCPEGIMWFFILHKQHLIIRVVSPPPPSYQVSGCLVFCFVEEIFLMRVFEIPFIPAVSGNVFPVSPHLSQSDSKRGAEVFWRESELSCCGSLGKWPSLNTCKFPNCSPRALM